MDLMTLTDRELDELQQGAADLLLEVSVERVRRMPCCDRCEAERRMALSGARLLEVIHD